MAAFATDTPNEINAYYRKLVKLIMDQKLQEFMEGRETNYDDINMLNQAMDKLSERSQAQVMNIQSLSSFVESSLSNLSGSSLNPSS